MDFPKDYWFSTGKFQALSDELVKLIPETGKSDKPHIELLRRMANIYYDYYNNGNETWLSIVDNCRADLEYIPPLDAPKNVRMFFLSCKEEYKELKNIFDEAQLREIEEGEYYDYEDERYLEEPYRFSKEHLEEMMDDTLLYVQSAILTD